MNSHTIDKFLELEKEVWDALQTGNMEKDSTMLSEDFLGVYDSGFAGKSEHCEQLKTGPTVAHYHLSDARIIVLTEKMVLLSYLAELKRIDNAHIGKLEKMYVSSIWSSESGAWKNIFSQDTAAISE